VGGGGGGGGYFLIRAIKVYAVEIRQLFPLKMALNIHENGFTIPKTISDCEK